MILQHLITIKNKGFTLIEIVMTILILGLTSLILIPYFGSIVSSPDPVLRERAVALGQSLMDEALAKRWDQNTPPGANDPLDTTLESSGRGSGLLASGVGLDGGELAGNRSNWNDVDDYNGHSETDNFLDQNNNAFTLTGYTRSAQVDYISSAADPINSTTPVPAGTTDSKRIIVTVTAPNGETFTFIAVSCNF